MVPDRLDRSDPVAVIDGQRWMVARPEDPIVPATVVGRGNA
ncbi:hypothetical protein MHPYR_600006 [uncultured Mycobacterium sp.]|uniref:Uncharacterized protein n=1 Tax=uncultured Mycobacterium sp. TaxID=171292 RepID=A0A1Y5PJ74_9MYCO|nr:hypothetical protein MHPYR_600006 [uncultured Mycobacterium sp.]